MVSCAYCENDSTVVVETHPGCLAGVPTCSGCYLRVCSQPFSDYCCHGAVESIDPITLFF